MYRANIAAAEKSLRLFESREAKIWLDAIEPDQHGWEWHFLKASCDESRQFFALEKKYTAMDVSADFQQMVVADLNGDVQIWQLPDMTIHSKFKLHDSNIYSIRFSPDAKKLVSIARDATTRVWSSETGEEICRLTLDNPGVAAAFSPDGSRVAACTWLMESNDDGSRQVHGVVWVWNAENGDVINKSLIGEKPLDSIEWRQMDFRFCSFHGTVSFTA
ncbi:MAG: hypothetical protein R3C03_15180 [Pirellulaceae bacterium]